MRKKLMLPFLLLLVFVLSACDVDYYEGQRPVEYPNTVWVCTEGNIKLMVEEKYNATAFWETESATYPVKFLWGSFGNSVIVLFDSAQEENPFEQKSAALPDTLFSGNCTFGPKQFRIKVTEANPLLTDKFPVDSEWIFKKQS